MKGLLQEYRAPLPCDHCGTTHVGYSFASQESAHATAQLMVDECRKWRVERIERTADSQRNYANRQ